MKLFGLFTALAALALAACSASDPLSTSSLKATPKTNDTVGNLLAGPALWDDPQNTPHPMFNWPTLSSPPAGSKQQAVPAHWQPVPARPLPNPITGLEHVAQAEDVVSGAGMAAFGNIAVVPGFGDASSIVDLSDPAHPRALSHFGGEHRGAAIIAYPSGRLVAVFSTGSIIDVWDLSDPRRPRRLPSLQPVQGSHKVGVVPGTPIVYNAASGGGGLPGGQIGQGTGVTEIFDLTDPDNPIHVQNFANGYSCHHVYFWNRPEQNKFRAICAGLEYTQLWDTADPRNPSVIVSVPVHHGVAGTPSGSVPFEAFSHYAGLNRDGTVLLVGDENGGGGLPPGCVASVSTDAGGVSVPVGAVWFYDVSTETSPLLMGWYSAMNDPQIKSATSSCTAHHGRLVPDPQGRDLLVMAFYGAGVILVDFSIPTLAHAIGQFAEGSNTWEAWYHNGYIITGDLARGLDVLTFK